MRTRIITIALTLLLIFGLVPPSAGAAPPDDDQPPAVTPGPKHPRLDSGLMAQAQAARLAADAGEPVRVIVELDEGVATAGLRAGLTAAGGSVEGEYANLVQALMPPAALEHVADLPGVRWVAPPAKPHFDAVPGEGVVATNDAAWQAAGLAGAGVKVAIIDGGFYGYTTRQASGDLPGSVVTADFCGGGFTTATAHGTAVAEIVHEMAPAAQLYLICFDTIVQLGQAVNYAITQGVTIINHSVGWFNTSRGDGSGGPGTPEGIAAQARAAGILWVNSAGNYAPNHWSGVFTDTNANGAHNFTPNDEGNTIYLGYLQVACVYLKWDSWPISAQDYDLVLVRSSTNGIVAYSINTQNGSQPPIEGLCYQNSGVGQYFYVAITRFSATVAPRFDLFILGVSSPEYVVPAGSLGDTASSPATFAAGAICWQGDGLEPYSSRGPTIDGRIKPDIAGPDSVSSATYGGFGGCGSPYGFAGTSASAPHVAGAAAVVKGAYPGFTVAQLEAFLAARAIDLPPAGKDTLTGAGKLWLGSPPCVPNGANNFCLSVAGTGSVFLNPPGISSTGGSYSYPLGTAVTLTPQPGSGQVFTGWIVDGVAKGWAAPLTLTMNAPHVVQATFVQAKTFADVGSGRQDYAAIVALASRGTIFGYNQTQYGPDDGVQRAQMAALIARATPTGPGTPPAMLTSGCVAGSWDCEDWGNAFTDYAPPASLWRNAGTLQHYGVAAGYTAPDCAARGKAYPCFGPTDPVTYAQTISFITRAMKVKGYWVAQAGAPPYGGVPLPHQGDVATFAFYTQGLGGVPAPPANWNAPATRGWFAMALWQALNSYWGTDTPGRGGYVP